MVDPGKALNLADAIEVLLSRRRVRGAVLEAIEAIDNKDHSSRALVKVILDELRIVEAELAAPKGVLPESKP